MSDFDRVHWSKSTWRQPPGKTTSPQRTLVLEAVVDRILNADTRRLRVAVDGRTAAGKTTFADEIASQIAGAGRVALRASLDDFKRPWRDAHLYDRVSGAGYYRNAFDLETTQRLLLAPAAPAGSGRVALGSIDPLTQIDLSDDFVEMPADGVLVVDGVFAFRPELNRDWDVRIWIDVDDEVALKRGIARDHEMEGSADAAERLHRERYQAAEAIYMSDVNPASIADIVIDNTDFGSPQIVRLD